MIQSKSKSCRRCIYNSHGDCLWFVEKERGDARPIPKNIFDKGCKQRMSRIESIPYHPTSARLIDLFHGELI